MYTTYTIFSLFNIIDIEARIRAAMTESNNAEGIPKYVPTPNYDPVLKIILVGEMGVGKTTLLTQFSDNSHC